MSSSPKSALRVALLGLAAVAVSLLAPAAPAAAATPPTGAFTYVGNIDDGARSGVVDRRNVVSGGSSTITTALDGGDDIAPGDVLGDAFDELVVADDDSGRIDIHDTSTGDMTSFGTSIGEVTAFEDADDDLAVGDVTRDGKDEIVVANTRFDLVIVYSKTGQRRKRLLDIGYDGGDRMVVGDFVPGRGRDEIAIVSDEDEGRIDVFDVDGNLLRRAHSGFDGGSDDVAAGDNTGDLVDEVVIANDEGGRIESVDFATGKTHTMTTGYDDDDDLGTGDVTGDGRAEILIANTEAGRVDVIDFFGDQGGTFTSAYDGDDEFAVGTFGSGDIDADAIPDRVELLGMRDAEGALVFDLEDRGASPCRKDVVVEVDHMAGMAPDQGALERAVGTFAGAAEVRPVADCPYSGVSTDQGINLIIDHTDPADQEEIPHETQLKGFAAVDALLARHADLAAPYVRHSLWVEDYVTDKGDSPAGQAGHGSSGLDFVVALDGKTAPDAHEATFVHELGHSLGLDHGGATDDLVNCKPNYLSVMNYSFRTGVPRTGGGFAMDYSHQRLGELDEAHLDEAAGIGGPSDLFTLWTDGKGDLVSEHADRALNWDGDDSDGNGDVADDNGPDGGGVAVDLNTKDPLARPRSGDPCENPNDHQAGLQKLLGHDDWDQLGEGLAGSGGGSAPPRTLHEPTTAQIVQALKARNDLVFPDTALELRPAKPCFVSNVLAVATDVAHVYATHTYRATTGNGALDGNGVLVVLDRDTMAVQARIPVGADPRSVAVNPRTNRAYVMNRGSGAGSSLSVVDLGARKVIAEIALGQVGIDVEVNTRLNRVYVSNPFAQSIQVVDGATSTLLAPVKVGKGLMGMAVDEATGIVYVAMVHRSSLPQFTALGRMRDTGRTRTILPQVDLGDPGTQAIDVALDPLRHRIHVGGLGGGTVAPSVTVLDDRTLAQVTRLPIPGPVRALDANPEAGSVFAVGDRGVEVIDAAALRITSHIDAGLPFSVATQSGPARQLFVGDLRDGRVRRVAYSSGVER